MSFIRIRTVNGVNYYYLLESFREAGKVKQQLIRYFGKDLPKEYYDKRLLKKIRLTHPLLTAVCSDKTKRS